MIIGILGYESPNSWTPLMSAAFNNNGYTVIQFSVNKTRSALGPLFGDEHLKYKRPVNLSDVIGTVKTQKIDVLFVAQSYMYTNNDLSIPVFYWHTELTSAITCRNPTHILYKLPEMDYWVRNYFPYEHHKMRHHFYIPPAVHPPHYNFEMDKDRLVSYIGAPSDTFDRIRDWVWNSMQRDMKQIEAHIKLMTNVHTFYDMGEKPADHKDYNEALARSNYMILTSHNGVYIGRRVFECCASKCVPIIWIENDNAYKCYKDLGFEESGSNQNCYMYRTIEDLDSIVDDSLKPDPMMANRAYNLIEKYHTFGHRCLTILKIMELTLTEFKIKPKEEIGDDKSPIIYQAKSMV
jgi:hypothetical protein